MCSDEVSKVPNYKSHPQERANISVGIVNSKGIRLRVEVDHALSLNDAIDTLNLLKPLVL